MSRKIHVVTTDKTNYPDLHSENLSMVHSLKKYGFEVLLTNWHEIYEQLIEQTVFDDVLLIRTVWDYPDYFDKFRHFLNLVRERRITTVNPLEIIEWNINKQYLFDLQRAGIPIVPCEFFPAGCIVPERENKSVVKPVVGLGASGAQILELGESISVKVDSIVNPFRKSIHDGELSVIMVSGNPELFIRKTPSQSDWRVQPQYGGKYTFANDAPEAAVNVCRKLFRYIQNRFQSNYLLFMRVDLLQTDINGEWEVLEFEAIDPSLYGSVSTKAIDALSWSLSKLIAND
ncbi:MAG: hypothetical protein IJB04_07820 [Oscillospiraceae bacterium]|nr:hypothetical protein [Oscillospiraceae bacterium]